MRRGEPYRLSYPSNPSLSFAFSLSLSEVKSEISLSHMYFRPCVIPINMEQLLRSRPSVRLQSFIYRCDTLLYKLSFYTTNISVSSNINLPKLISIHRAGLLFITRLAMEADITSLQMSHFFTPAIHDKHLDCIGLKTGQYCTTL